jgi:hypothetical protein
MSKLRFPETGLIAMLARSIKSNQEPCHEFSDECNTSTVKAWYTLRESGLKVPGYYHGRKCKHGYPTSAGPLAYILDNYVQRAERFPCDPALVHMLRGTVSLMLFKNIHGTGGKSELDLWVTDRCEWMSLLGGLAEEVWLWPLGNFNYKTFTKAPRRRKAAHAVIF